LLAESEKKRHAVIFLIVVGEERGQFIFSSLLGFVCFFLG
jgi:hypothetical protein